MITKTPKVTKPKPACTKCGLWKKSAINCMRGVGPLTTPLMVVGETPSKDDEAFGVFLSGRVGNLFNEVLAHCGLDRNDIYIDMICKCRPELASKTPLPNQVEKCLPYLEDMIKTIKPKVIVTLGNAALRGLTGISVIDGWRGKILYSRIYDCYIVPTYALYTVYRNLHPIPTGEDREKRPSHFSETQMIQDFALARDLLQAAMPKQVKNDYKVITDSKEAISIIQNLKDDVAVDIETTGLSFHKDKIIGISLSDKSFFGRYLVWDCFKDSDASASLRNFLASDKRKILQNTKFDQKFLKYNGYPVNGVFFDTKLADALIDENRSHSLKDMVYLYTDTGGYEKQRTQSLKEQKGKWENVPIEIMGEYSCFDADNTYRLYRRYSEELKRQGLDKLFETIVMPFSQVLTDIEYRGIAVDKNFMIKLGSEFEEKLGILSNKIKLLFGDRELNVKSGKQLAKKLYMDLKLPIPKLTKKAKTASTDAEALKEIENLHPGIPVILEYKKLDKLMSTYITGMLEQISPIDGRVHTSYNQDGTITGRLSSNEPNLQNIPKKSDIKKIFSPPTDYYFLNADYSQIELRVMASYSQDPILMHAYQVGDDIHTTVAAQCFGVPFNDVTPEQRDGAKVINFGLIYGRGPRALAKQLKWEVEDAKRFISKYFQTFQGVQIWMNRQKLMAARDLQVTNIFGRIRRLPEMESDSFEDKGHAERSAMNSPIQSTASDICVSSMIRLSKMLESTKSRIVGQVHDSIMFEIHKDEISLLSLIKTEMLKPVAGLYVPLDAKLELCDRWGGVELCQKCVTPLTDYKDELGAKKKKCSKCG